MEILGKQIIDWFIQAPRFNHQTKSEMDTYAYFLTVDGELSAFPNYKTQDIITHYQRVAPLNTAVKMLASAIASLPIVLKTPTGETVDNHPVLKLLNNPNHEDQKTQRELLRDIAIWRIIDGDAYLTATGAVEREPLELYVLNPGNLSIQPDNMGYPGTYHYTRAAQALTFVKDPITHRIISENKMGELLHIKNFNPQSNSSCLDGMPEILPLWYEVQQYLHGAQHNLGLLRNGARPSGALVLKTKDGGNARLNDDQYTRLKTQMDSEFSGAMNAGKPVLLEGGLEWQEMSINNKDMDFKELKVDSEKQIYRNLGIPTALVMDEGATYNNKREARLELYEGAVLPLGEDIVEKLNRFLMPRYNKANQQDKGLILSINQDDVEALQIKRDLRRDTIEKSPVLTMNEKRQELGYDTIAGGDAVFTASGVAIAGEVPEPEPADDVPAKRGSGGKPKE